MVTKYYDGNDELYYIDNLSDDDEFDEYEEMMHRKEYFESYYENSHMFIVTLPDYFIDVKKFNIKKILPQFGDDIFFLGDNIFFIQLGYYMKLHYKYTLTIKELMEYNTYVNEKITKYRNNLINIFPNDITNIIIDYIK